MKNKDILKRIFRDYIKNTGKTRFIFTIFFGFFVASVTVIEPLIFVQLIKKVELFLTTGEFNYSNFIIYLLFWGGFIIFSSLNYIFYRYYLVSKPCIKNHVNTTSKYINNIINMNYDVYLSKEVGKIYKIFDRGVENTFQFLFFIFLDLIKNGGGIILIIIILFLNNIIMAFITLSLLPVMIFVGFLFYKKLFPIQNEVNVEWENIYSDLGNSMSVFSLVKTLSLEKVFTNKFNKALNNCYNKQVKLDKGWTISDIYISFFVMVSRFLVLGFGVYFVFQGKIAFATLFLFFSYIGWIFFPLGYLFSRLRNVQQWLTAIGTFYENFENLESEHKDNKGKKIKDIKGKIEFRNVNFGYGKNKVLADISFKVKAGEKIAFVGNTGAGKSTIVNLFLRFWNIEDGEILLDGINTQKINLKSLRKNIGVVSQDSSLFNMSIRENLMFANSKATQKDLEKALKKAEANFVFKLEDGLDSIIGERGLKLSGGEKQRLSIARLFLKDPKILILDEATSALDNKTEKLIQKALDKLMKGRTSIVVAHRLSTIKNADNIFMMKDGKIIENGSYKKLINKKGEFFNLINPDSLIIN